MTRLAAAGRRGWPAGSRPERPGAGRRSSLASVLCLGRAAVGVAYLYRAATGASSRSRAGLSPAVHAVLGVRQLGQALASVEPTTAVLVLGAEVDAAHAASMAAAALLPRPWRRAALLDGLLAGSMAAAGLAVADAGHGLGQQPQASQVPWLRWRDGCAVRLAGFLVPDWLPGSGRRVR